jgi:hypothetical protein
VTWVSSPPNLFMSRFGDGLAAGPDLAAAESAVMQAQARCTASVPPACCAYSSAVTIRRWSCWVGSRAMAVAGTRTTLGSSAGGVISAGRGWQAALLLNP